MRKFVLALIICLVTAVPTFPQQTDKQHQLITQIEALLQELRTTLLPPAPPAIVLSDAAGIHTALNTPGTYKIAPGEYVGNFVFSASDVVVDASGVVFRPEIPSIPTVRITGNNVTITGLDVMNGYEGGETFTIGSNTITTMDELPRGIKLERVRLYAGERGGKRGFALHGINITLIDCEAHNYWRQGQDSQAIWINNGPGPYTVLGEFYEASGENIMVGGAKQGILSPDAIPSDITVRNAHLYKPLDWKTKPGSVKNLFELKAGRRVLVENCVLENNWKDAQAGSAILIKADNQENSTPWIETSDVVFRGNIIRNSPDSFAINIRGIHTVTPAQRVRNVVFDHNLFVGIGNGIQTGNGVDGLTLTHNTFLTVTNTFLSFYDDQIVKFPTPLVCNNNVFHEGLYSIKGSGAAAGIATLNLYAAAGYQFVGNVIERNRGYVYPEGNTLLAAGELLLLLDPVTFKYPGDAGY